MKNGEKFSLADSEYILIENIPEGVKYIVSEEDYTKEDYETSYSQNRQGIIKAGVTEEILVINKYSIEPGTIAITKTVVGENADFDKKFDFEIKLESKQKPKYLYTIVYSDGTKLENQQLNENSLKFKLGHNDTIYIYSVCYGTKYEVIEDEQNFMEYNLKLSENSKGEITEQNKTSEVVFVNEKKAPLIIKDNIDNTNDTNDTDNTYNNFDKISYINKVGSNILFEKASINTEQKSKEEILKTIEYYEQSSSGADLLQKARDIINNAPFTDIIKQIVLDNTGIVDAYEVKNEKPKDDLTQKNILASQTAVDAYSSRNNKNIRENAMVVDSYYASNTADNTSIWFNICCIVFSLISLISLFVYKMKKIKA